MGPTLPAVDRYENRRRAQQTASELIRGFAGKLEEKKKLDDENKYFKERGEDIEGLRGKAREMKQHEFFKRESKRKMNEALREPEKTPRSGAAGTYGAEGSQPYKQEALPNFMGKQTGVEPKQGLYTQRTMQGELQPVKSWDQVQEEGVQTARRISEAGDYPMSDQEGIALANQKNNEALQSNQRLEQENHKIQGEKSIFNEKGQTIAANTISPESLTPDVINHFGKRAENLAGIVKTQSDLDNLLAKEIKDYKNTVAVVESSIPAFRGTFGADETRLTPKSKTDIRIKLDPLLKLGFYDQARHLLAKKGAGLEEREELITDLSENTNKVLGQMPSLAKPKKVTKGGGLAVLAQAEQDMKNKYSENDKQLIDSTVGEAFEKDPNTNIVLLRQAMRKKGVDWRMYKDALDKAIYTGKLNMTDEQRTQYDKMNEPELSGLERMLHFFGIGGK